jgi:hypothetical protein
VRLQNAAHDRFAIGFDEFRQIGIGQAVIDDMAISICRKRVRFRIEWIIPSGIFLAPHDAGTM